MKLIPGSKRRHHGVRVGIFLLAVILIAGTQGCTGPPPGLQIHDWYDLDAVRDNLDGNYILMNDLDSTTAGYEDLAGPAANGGKGWQPIGGIHAHFTGAFDGQGHEIHDLFINRPDEFRVALFADVYRSATIKDVGMVNVTITGDSSVGSLVGYSGGTVSNSYSSGSVTGDNGVGGLVGVNLVYVLYDGAVSDSYYTGSVSGTSEVGGLVGSNYGTVSNSYSTGSVTGYGGVGGLVGDNREGTVSYCYSIASVTGEATVGGLAGYSDGAVSNSYSSGNVIGVDAVGGLAGVNHDSTVSHSYSTGDVTGASSVGGLAGVNGYDATVSDCYSTGNVTGNWNVGGLVGENYEGAVSNSYSTGNVIGVDAVGGLVGVNHGSTVSHSYSTGDVTGNSFVGGLIGVNNATVSNSFWDTQTSGQTTSDGGTGKNTTEMQDIATFSGAGWNITAVDLNETNPAYIWNIVNNVTYPFLSWQS